MMRCPRCKGNVRVFGARTTVIVYSNGTDVDGDIEWDEGNEAECVSCDWSGTAGEAEDGLEA
jgi:hypothetical protein